MAMKYFGFYGFRRWYFFLMGLSALYGVSGEGRVDISETEPTAPVEPSEPSAGRRTEGGSGKDEKDNEDPPIESRSWTKYMQSRIDALSNIVAGVNKATGKWNVDKKKAASAWPESDITFTGHNPMFRFSSHESKAKCGWDEQYINFATTVTVIAPEIHFSDDVSVPTCPTCKKRDNVGTSGFSKPRRVCSENGQHFLVQRIYKCKVRTQPIHTPGCSASASQTTKGSCLLTCRHVAMLQNCPHQQHGTGKSVTTTVFNALDEHVLHELPNHVEEQYRRYIMTAKSGILKETMDSLKREVASPQVLPLTVSPRFLLLYNAAGSTTDLPY
jgi:hypothetical protein